LQLNATTNPKPNLKPNSDPNPKTNANSTLKSEHLNMVVLGFRCLRVYFRCEYV